MKGFRKEFYPNGDKRAPLCEVVYADGPNWNAAKLVAGFYWWRNDDLGDLDTLHGPFETSNIAIADAAALWESEKDLSLW